MERICELYSLREYLNVKGMDLSGGLKRRVQVAKTFLIDKPVVFLDEATTGMDSINKRATIQAIKEETRKGRTIVLTTHILDEAEVLCDRVAILNHGKLMALGSIQEVKGVGLRLLSLSLTMKAATPELLATIQSFHPVSVEVRNSTVELILRDEEETLKLLALARKVEGFLHFEITSASLEDVFLQLIDHQGRGTNIALNGVLDAKKYTRERERSWIFRTVGYGHDAGVWKAIVSALRTVGYDHVLSIEHEDSLMSGAEGLKKAIAFLQEIVIREPAGEAYWA